MARVAVGEEDRRRLDPAIEQEEDLVQAVAEADQRRRVLLDHVEVAAAGVVERAVVVGPIPGGVLDPGQGVLDVAADAAALDLVGGRITRRRTGAITATPPPGGGALFRLTL